MNSKKKDVFFDIGLLLNQADVSKIYVYLPFEVNKECVFDLGSKFNDVSILTGIFNANYSVASNYGCENKVDIKEGDVPLFTIYSLDINKEVEFISKYGGTIMSFEIPKIDDANIYYRFRIKVDDFTPILKCYRPKNTFFESAFIETTVVDFRLNEHRNQDPLLIQHISNKSTFKINKIKLFLMTPLEDDVESDGQNFVFQRRLEEGSFWTKYLDMDYSDMNVYKCLNGPDEDGNFYCYSKIRYRRGDKITITIYTLFLGLFTIIMGILANIASCGINNIFIG